ncbi:MAG: heme o synthase, partial [Gemmataceae bacterium]|nr:heme o synthase [Gemmataceae bacterium]
MKLASTAYPQALPQLRGRLADYAELTKPRIAALVLFTVAIGGLLAAGGLPPRPLDLFHVVFGTALVAAGASALNHLLERDSDALMRRTEQRPLPTGRLTPAEALVFGSVLATAGLVYLGLTLRHPAAAILAGVSFVGYVVFYTPLKRRTPLNTLVGAVPGALPPVIGWVAIRGQVEPGAVALFAVLFLWQVPHFLAIAWIHRDDYARAGLCMLPVRDHSGEHTARQMLRYCLMLVPTSLVPVFLGAAGPVYFVGALVLGLGFVLPAWTFGRERSVAQARRVLRYSLVYLPALLALLLVD